MSDVRCPNVHIADSQVLILRTAPRNYSPKECSNDFLAIGDVILSFRGAVSRTVAVVAVTQLWLLHLSLLYMAN